MSMTLEGGTGYHAQLIAERRARQARIAAAAVPDRGIDLKRERDGPAPPVLATVAACKPPAPRVTVKKTMNAIAECLAWMAAEHREDRLARGIPPRQDEGTEDSLPRISIDKIISFVCKVFSISRVDLLSRRRQYNVVRPRQTAMYLSRMLTLRSLPEIGRRFGGKDHTTVLHAVRKVAALRASGDRFIVESLSIISAVIEAEGFDVSPLAISQAGMDVEAAGVAAG